MHRGVPRRRPQLVAEVEPREICQVASKQDEVDAAGPHLTERDQPIGRQRCRIPGGLQQRRERVRCNRIGLDYQHDGGSWRGRGRGPGRC